MNQSYQDIVDTPWPQPSLRGRMPLESRAKIFMPFSALKGLTQELQKRINSPEPLPRPIPLRAPPRCRPTESPQCGR